MSVIEIHHECNLAVASTARIWECICSSHDNVFCLRTDVIPAKGPHWIPLSRPSPSPLPPPPLILVCAHATDAENHRSNTQAGPRLIHHKKILAIQLRTLVALFQKKGDPCQIYQDFRPVLRGGNPLDGMSCLALKRAAATWHICPHGQSSRIICNDSSRLRRGARIKYQHYVYCFYEYDSTVDAHL